ncbi:hypothetical protein M2271_006636 [Streptomyces sp. LBL]|nr:hypothetical protein [Streptomyces sp. LBL]
MTRSLQAYAYAQPSAVRSTGEGNLLGLQTSGGLSPRGAEAHPRFFPGS